MHAHPTSRGQRAKRGGGRWRDTVWIASDGIKKRADRCSCSNRNGVGCGTRRWWETLAVSTTVRRRPTNTSSARAKGWSALPQAELGRARLLCAGTGWQLSLTPCQHASCLFMHAGAECDRSLRARHGYLPPLDNHNHTLSIRASDCSLTAHTRFQARNDFLSPSLPLSFKAGLEFHHRNQADSPRRAVGASCRPFPIPHACAEA